MPYKRIVVLANSVKHAPGRCVAGRELLPTGELGAWVRPVSNVGEGQLYAHHMRVAGGGAVNVLDVFDIPLVGHCGDAVQPENWLVDEQLPWQRQGTWAATNLPNCYDNPTNLWLDAMVRSDRIRVAQVGTLNPSSSICIIPLQNPTISPDTYSQNRDRVAFGYQGVHYSLKLTDPMYSRGQQQQVPTAACVSLTPPFNGHHFKLVATLFW